MKKAFNFTLIVLLFAHSNLFGQKVKRLNACWWVNNSIDSRFFTKNIKQIIYNSDEVCVLSLLDKLVDSAGRRNGNVYIQYLCEIRKISDGYVSEYFDEIGSELFFKHFDNLLSELYFKGKINFVLEKFVLRSLAVSVNDSRNQEVEKKKILELIKVKQNDRNLKVEQSKYLDNFKIKFLDEVFNTKD